jgi:hypothetical protein
MAPLAEMHPQKNILMVNADCAAKPICIGVDAPYLRIGIMLSR